MAKKARVISIGTNAEPTWDRPYGQADISLALAWYNNNKTDKDAAKYLSISDANVANRFLSLAWSLRMQSRGCVFTEKSQQTINGMHEMLKEKLKEFVVPDEDKQSENVVSIQDRVAAKTDLIIGELEGLVDEFGIRGNTTDMKAYQWLVDNEVKSIHAAKIAEYFNGRAAELEANYKNDELKEYYDNFDKKKFLNLFKCYTLIATDAERLASNAKATRKPRKKKPVSFEKMVKGLKFQKKDDTLKLQSVDPVKVVGATQLWIYNTKTRKLGVYNARDNAGLIVKGSTLQNYAVNTSISKTLRKPEKVLKIVTDGGKIALRKVLDEVNSKPTEMTGRINKDTILLRVVSN